MQGITKRLIRNKYLHYKPEFLPEKIRHYNMPTSAEFYKYAKIEYAPPITKKGKKK